MAITGTGTQGDPFIVHDYEELRYACEQHESTFDPYYTKLANDINGNDYGADFQWETITLGSNSSSALKNNQIDLDGHTIQNIFIKDSNSLFASHNVEYAGVRNGKILNVFGSNPSCFATKTTFENISASAQFSTSSSGFFNACQLNNASTYLIMMFSGGKAAFENCTDLCLNNVDMYVELYNASTSTSVIRMGGITMKTNGIRLTGKMKFETHPVTNAGKFISTGKMMYSVIDFDLTDYDYSGGNSSYIINTGDNTSVINTELIPRFGTTLTASSYINATTEQIRNGAALRSLGFSVVNVGE